MVSMSSSTYHLPSAPLIFYRKSRNRRKTKHIKVGIDLSRLSKKNKSQRYNGNKRKRIRNQLPDNFRLSMRKASTCVIVLDGIDVPRIVREMIGLGPKFVFPSSTSSTKPNIVGLITSVRTVANALPCFGASNRLMRGIKLVIDDYANREGAPGRCTNATESPYAPEQYLCNGFRQTRHFLSQHPEISVTESDKGHMSIICLTETLQNKRREFIEKQLANGVYGVLHQHAGMTSEESYTNHLERISRAKTTDFAYLTRLLNPIFAIDAQKGLQTPRHGQLKQHAYHMSVMSIAMKSHKGDAFPIRPIIAAPAAMGRDLDEYMLRRLERLYQNDSIVPNINDMVARTRDRLTHFRHIVGDAHTVCRELEVLCVPPGHVMYTVDASDMYTNVDTEATLRIIERKFDVHIAATTTMTCATFINALRKLLCLNEHFSAGLRIYMQRKGLPMGGKLSYALSEICTSEGLTLAAEEAQSLGIRISYVAKYVDDMLIIMERKKVMYQGKPTDSIDVLTELLVRHTFGMRFTFEMEEEGTDGNGEIRYLNMLVMRNHQCLTTIWAMQSYATGRFTNAFSAHQIKDRICTVKEKIRTALKLSSERNKRAAFNIVYKLCRDNGYGHKLLARVALEICTDEGISIDWLTEELVHMRSAIADEKANPDLAAESTANEKPAAEETANIRASNDDENTANQPTDGNKESTKKRKRMRRKCSICGSRLITWNHETAHKSCLQLAGIHHRAVTQSSLYEGAREDFYSGIEELKSQSVADTATSTLESAHTSVSGTHLKHIKINIVYIYGLNI